MFAQKLDFLMKITNTKNRPYFYPKIRDGVYKRTLFIAQNHSAILSNSIGNHTQGALNLLQKL